MCSNRWANPLRPGSKSREPTWYTSQTVTAGIGLRPAGSRWTFDAGYSFEWLQADFGSPDQPRGTRQQLGAELRWDF